MKFYGQRGIQRSNQQNIVQVDVLLHCICERNVGRETDRNRVLNEIKIQRLIVQISDKHEHRFLVLEGEET